MFDTDKDGPWIVVHPVGEIDLAVADEFRTTVLEALSRADHVAVDFSGVTFLDASGLSVIAAALEQTKALSAQLVLVGLSEQTRRVFDITRMAKILDIRARLASNEEFAVEWTLKQSGVPAAS